MVGWKDVERKNGISGGRKIAWVFERSRTNTARVGRVLMELEILNKPAGSSTGHRSLIAFRNGVAASKICARNRVG